MALDEKTLGLLRSWKKKHGLDVLQGHLDKGLFSPDEGKRQLCYAWIERQRGIQKAYFLGRWVAYFSLLLAVFLWVMAALEE